MESTGPTEKEQGFAKEDRLEAPLFKPIKMGEVELPNRVVMAALTR